jgi:hypothetical protein
MCPVFALFAVLAVSIVPQLARAQSGDPGTPSIMAPEPGTKEKAPPHKKRIGSSSPVYPAPLPPPLHYVPPPVGTVTPPPHIVPPAIVVPQTGMTVPNLPTVGGAGPGGSETSQDRAARCAHQAGLYGPGMTGDRNAYINQCFSQ